MFSRISYANVTATLALVLALTGGALAASNSFIGAGGQIHGCVSRNGQLTLLRPGQSCKSGTAISWNQKGQTGPRGRQGPQGPRGSRGLRGAPGVNGVVARARSVRGVVSSTRSKSIPLQGNSWHQASNEDDELIGQVNYKQTSCSPAPALTVRVGASAFKLGLYRPGKPSGTLPLSYINGIPSVTTPWVFAPGGAGRRDRIRASVGGCKKGGNLKVNWIHIDVIGLR